MRLLSYLERNEERGWKSLRRARDGALARTAIYGFGWTAGLLMVLCDSLSKGLLVEGKKR